MQIHIDWIDTQLSIRGNSTGYRMGFRSELTSGTAVLGNDDNVPAMQGAEISVEVSWEAIQGLRVLSPDEPHNYSLSMLSEEGDYEAVGDVLYSEWDDGYYGASVRVGDAMFHWTSSDIGDTTFTPGDWVCFIAVGLVLWDCHY